MAGYDREKGTVDIIFQIVGGTTMELNSLNAGDSVHDFVGPLGRATETEGLKKVCVVGGGVGCAIALPIAKELHDQGCTVHSVIGFRNKDLLILEDEFNACSDELRIMTDDAATAPRVWSLPLWTSWWPPATSTIWSSPSAR